MAIDNRNPGIRDLLPELTGGAGSSDIVRHDAHRPNWTRPAQVSTGVRTTYVVPGDWPGKPDDWYPDDAPTYPWRKQNNVEYLIDGEETFQAMVEAIETATGPDHFIVILGWACHVDFVLSKRGDRCPGAQRCLLDILKERVEMGVRVRVLLYYNWFADTDAGGTSAEVDTKHALDELEPVKPPPPAQAKIRCILDDRHKAVGVLARSAHHQKVLLVYGSEGLVGFFGGVDINEDRVNPSKLRLFEGPAIIDQRGPLHDVHARVLGEAAEDLMVLATNRWNFSVPFEGIGESEDDGKQGSTLVYYKSGQAMDDMNVFLERARSNRTAPPEPHYVVKLGQTVGNPDLAKLQDNTAWTLVRHAIQNAKRFIYLEDQYLWSVDAAEELGKAAARLAHITILFTWDDLMPPGGTDLRYRALKRMKEAAGADAEKIRIYVIRDTLHQYIHAKMWIFDDEYLIVGSANCNARGYFTDSEVNGGVADPEWESETGPRGGRWYNLELNLAHKLRIELWHEHLLLDREWLVDGVAAELHWRFASSASNVRIKPYTLPFYVGDGARIYHPLWHEYMYGDYPETNAMTLADPKM